MQTACLNQLPSMQIKAIPQGLDGFTLAHVSPSF